MATKKPAPRSKPKKKNPVPVVARNPSSPLERMIADGMARAFHVSAWADREEELGRLPGGMELMDIAPPTTEEAKQEAWKLIGAMEAANGMNLPAIYAQALIADGKTTKDLPEGWVSVAEDNAEEFGHYMAMQSLGHGVSWFDDHKEFTIPQVSGRGKKFVVPHTEFYYFDPSEYGGEPSGTEADREDNPRSPESPRHPDDNPRHEDSAPRRPYDDNPPAPYHHPDPQHEKAPRHLHRESSRHDENPRHPYDDNPRPQNNEQPRREDNPRRSHDLPVLFRLGREPDDVFAVFPTLPGTNDPNSLTVYQHVGQHSSGDRHDVMSSSRPASPMEYSDLLRELRGIYETGPNAVHLVIMDRISREMDEERHAAGKRHHRGYNDNPRRPAAPHYEENHRTPAEGAWSRPVRYEFSEGTSNKFWEIQIGDRKIRTHFGRIGYEGQIWTSPKFRSEEEAGAEFDRLVHEKTRKGYRKARGRAYADNPGEGARYAGRGPGFAGQGASRYALAGGSASPRRGGGFADNPRRSHDDNFRRPR